MSDKKTRGNSSDTTTIKEIENGKERQNGRRSLLKKTSLVAGVIAVSQTEWAKPVVNSIVLPAHAQTSAQTIAEIAQATGALSTLVSVLTQAQVDALNGAGPLTVFAPTNDAFTAIQSTIDTLTAAEIETIVDYHVISGSVPFSSIPATTGTAANLVQEVTASNGTVFVIDQVLLP